MQRKAQLGFSIVTAIFLLVVLAVLGAAMVTFSTSQQQSSAMDVLGSRAYQAARAGIEWGSFQIAQSAVVTPPAGVGSYADHCKSATSAAPYLNPAPITLSGTLSIFSVSVSCYSSQAIESTNTVWVYNITSTAKTGAVVGSTDYIERVLNASLAQ